MSFVDDHHPPSCPGGSSARRRWAWHRWAIGILGDVEWREDRWLGRPARMLLADGLILVGYKDGGFDMWDQDVVSAVYKCEDLTEALARFAAMRIAGRGKMYR